MDSTEVFCLDYSVDYSTFLCSVELLLSKSIPAIDLVVNKPSLNEGNVEVLKTLPDLLSSIGNPLSCPFCCVPLVNASSARVCIACGKALGPISSDISSRWENSLAKNYFISSFSGSNDSFSVHEAPSSPNPLSTSRSENPLFSTDSVFDFSESNSITIENSDMQELHMFSQATTVSPTYNPLNEMGGETSKADDIFLQLSELNANESKSSSIDTRYSEILSAMPDLSFMLADHLVIPQKDGVNSMDVESSNDKEQLNSAMENSQKKKENVHMVEATTNDWGDFIS